MIRSMAIAFALFTPMLAMSLGQIGPFGGGANAVRLWAGRAPGAVADEPADIPTITPYLPSPEKATGAAIVVCPGGGYGFLADHEAIAPGKWLAERGVAAFVLKYRLAPRYHYPAMPRDVSRAIRVVRARAAEWKVDPKRIGIWGFSAGGHLASTGATHFDDGKPDAEDPIERVSSRPDCAILCYPVITMDSSFTHMGSRVNLLGDNPAPSLVERFSNEKQVTAKTPPTFIFHTADDGAVPLKNALEFAASCRKNNVPVELHVYEHGPHGVGLAQNDPILGTWTGHLEAWLKQHGFLK